MWKPSPKFHLNDSKCVGVQPLSKVHLPLFIWITESCKWREAPENLLQLTAYLRSGFLGPQAPEFWISPRMGTPQPLQTTCCGVSLSWQGKFSFLNLVSISHIPTFVPCLSSNPYDVCKLNTKKLTYWTKNIRADSDY